MSKKFTFEAELDEAEEFKKILDGVKELVKDANFDVSSGGLSLQAMDTSHVSLVYLSMRESCFESFNCDKALSLGVNMANMAKILKCANNNDKVTIKCSEESDSITFQFESNRGDKFSEFSLKLTEIETDDLAIPETEYSATITMGSSTFKKICADLSQLGDTCTITVGKDGVGFAVNGEAGSGSVQVKPGKAVDDETETVIEVTEQVSLTFALKYLNQFCKSASLSDKVKLCLSKESPLLVEFSLKDEDDGFIRFYLAPKIDEDDDGDDDDDGDLFDEDDSDSD